MKSYIQSNAAGAYDTVATDAAHSTSFVSTYNDVEGYMNAGPGDKKTDEEEEAALDDAEGSFRKRSECIGLFLHQFIYDMNSYFKKIYVLMFVFNRFIYKMNSYI
jgi:hypothetical protein